MQYKRVHQSTVSIKMTRINIFATRHKDRIRLEKTVYDDQGLNFNEEYDEIACVLSVIGNKTQEELMKCR